VTLAERAELLVVAPASADFLAKAAHGLADDLLSTLYLAYRGRVLMVPAMNTAMWEQPAVQRNIAQLRADGVQFIDPESGWLSCRQVGAGRMAAPEKIFEAVKGVLAAPKGERGASAPR
jgi:phosphopantothenoylcysteine decarboxylase/phosphopantothenate--cysteine ligase